MVGLGAFLLFVGLFSAIMLYRVLKYGRIMHVVPYLFSVLGFLILMIGQWPDLLNPIGSALIMTTITAVVHGAVIFDMRKDAAKNRL
jgi:hypothetical protein